MLAHSLELEVLESDILHPNSKILIGSDGLIDGRKSMADGKWYVGNCLEGDDQV